MKSSGVDTRILEVAKFEFRRFLDIKGEVITLLILLLIAGIRFGGDLLMQTGRGDTVIAVAVEGLVQPGDSPKGRYQFGFLPAVPATRATNFRRVADGTLDALLIPSADMRAFELHVRDVPIWREDLQAAFDPVRRRIIGAKLGLTPENVSLLEAQPTFSVHSHGASTSKPEATYAVAIAFMVMVVMGVMGALNVILQGVVTEKFGRISEMVLSAIPAQVWIDGKLIAATAHGLKTTVLYSLYGCLAAILLGFLTLPVIQQIAADGLNLLLLLSVCGLGVAFWSCGFAAVAALMPSANSPIKNSFVFVPMSMLLMTLGGVKDPSNSFLIFLSYFPPSSAFAMPVRMLHGTASLASVGLSVALLVLACALLRSFTIGVFHNAVMDVADSKISLAGYLRNALRAARGG